VFVLDIHKSKCLQQAVFSW